MNINNSTKPNTRALNSHSQRQKILERLRQESMTTLQAREQLFIMHPSARVQELKESGYNIVTRMVKSGGSKIAQYTLLYEDISHLVA